MVAFDRFLSKLFSLRFSNKSVQAPSCERPKTTQRNLILSFENNNCFPITVQRRRIMKKSRKLSCHVANSNITVDSLPTLQISVGFIALFEKIYDGEPILTVISNIGEDVQYRCFNQVYYVRSVSQPDTMPLLGYNNCSQITETGFAEQF